MEFLFNEFTYWATFPNADSVDNVFFTIHYRVKKIISLEIIGIFHKYFLLYATKPVCHFVSFDEAYSCVTLYR